ncbi:hypothetical protein GCM10009681_41200 [Luedemannella helvata]|uniref:Uncharacterized protein n=1 Tax=Luedemannella helvata TaxID=349315 RepID=A0ABN2KUH9_9ACTN
MAPFNVTLTRPVTVIPTVAMPSDLDFDSVVMELCQVLSETDCTFRIGGFGQSNWPVDVRYDLSTLVEQLPDVLSQIRSRELAEIDFYGQGVERTLRFGVGEERVFVSCISRTRWVPDPAEEELGYSELLSMLESVAAEFSESVQLIWPQLAEMKPFSEWRSSTAGTVRRVSCQDAGRQPPPDH